MSEEINETTEEAVEETTEQVDEPTLEEDDFDLEEALGGDRRFEEVNNNEEEGTEDNPEEDVENEDTGDIKEEQKYSLKIDGEEQEFTLDQLKNMASKASGADKKFYEASEGRRKLQDVVTNMKDSPWETLQKLGHDPVKLAEDLLYEKYRLKEMSDEEREIYNIRKENEKFKQEKEMSSRQAKELELQQATESAKEQYDREFTEALHSVDIPKDANSVKRMASYVEEGLRSGVEVTASDAARLVAEDLVNEATTMLSKLEADKLESILGKDVVKKLQNHGLSKIKDPEQGNRASTNKVRKKSKAPSMRTISSLFSDIESTL